MCSKKTFVAFLLVVGLCLFAGCGTPFMRGFTGQLDPTKIAQHVEVVESIDALDAAYEREREALETKWGMFMESGDLESARAVTAQMKLLATKYQGDIKPLVSKANDLASVIKDESTGWGYKAGALIASLGSIVLGVALKNRGVALRQVVQGVELLGLKKNQKGILFDNQSGKTVRMVENIRNDIMDTA